MFCAAVWCQICVLRYVYLISVALCVVWPSKAMASSEAKHIHYGFPDQFVLTTRLGENGEPDNPLLRLSSVLLREAGLKWSHTQYPAARLFQNLEDGTANFTILVNAPQLKECCILSAKPIMQTEVRIYRRTSSPAIKSLEDLKNKRIITIRGYSYGRLRKFLHAPENTVTRYATDTHSSAFSMLDAGRAQYLLDYKGPAIETLEKHPIENVTYDTIDLIDVHIVLHKNFPNAPVYMKQFEKIISELDLEKILALPY